MTSLTSALLEAANLAPSAHNTQPWRLRFGPCQLEVWADLSRALPAADPDNRDLLHALGALVENCQLTLEHHGFRAGVSYAGRLDALRPVAVLEWPAAAEQPLESELYRMIPIRRTSRIAYVDAPVSREVLARLEAAVSAPFRLRVLTAPADLAEMRQIAAAADLALMEVPAICVELGHWLRFSRKDPAWYRDGLNAECMGWSSLEAAVAKRLIRPRMVRALKQLGLARPLLGQLDQQAPFSPALCLLTTSSGTSVADHAEGGRQLQRLWLAAAAAGLCTHPLSAAVDHGPSRAETFRLFGAGGEEMHVNLFRLGSSLPTPRSHRLPADEILRETPGLEMER